MFFLDMVHINSYSSYGVLHGSTLKILTPFFSMSWYKSHPGKATESAISEWLNMIKPPFLVVKKHIVDGEPQVKSSGPHIRRKYRSWWRKACWGRHPGGQVLPGVKWAGSKTNWFIVNLLITKGGSANLLKGKIAIFKPLYIGIAWNKPAEAVRNQVFDAAQVV